MTKNVDQKQGMSGGTFMSKPDTQTTTANEGAGPPLIRTQSSEVDANVTLRIAENGAAMAGVQVS